MPDFIEVGRFEDCQASHGREFARLWAATNENRISIEEFKRVIYRTQGGALILQGLITLACSSAGVALFLYFAK